MGSGCLQAGIVGVTIPRSLFLPKGNRYSFTRHRPGRKCALLVDDLQVEDGGELIRQEMGAQSKQRPKGLIHGQGQRYDHSFLCRSWTSVKSGDPCLLSLIMNAPLPLYPPNSVLWRSVNRQEASFRAEPPSLFPVPQPLQVQGIRGLWVWIQSCSSFPRRHGKPLFLSWRETLRIT